MSGASKGCECDFHWTVVTHYVTKQIMPAEPGYRAIWRGDDWRVDGDFFTAPVVCWALCREEDRQYDQHGRFRGLESLGPEHKEDMTVVPMTIDCESGRLECPFADENFAGVAEPDWTDERIRKFVMPARQAEKDPPPDL